MNPLDLCALAFTPSGPGFWSASDRLNGGATTTRAIGAANDMDALSRCSGDGVPHARPDGGGCLYLGVAGHICMKCGTLVPAQERPGATS